MTEEEAKKYAAKFEKETGIELKHIIHNSYKMKIPKMTSKINSIVSRFGEDNGIFCYTFYLEKVDCWKIGFHSK